MDILIGQIASAVQLQGFISGEEQLKGSFDLFTLPEHQYEGSYTITPTESEQVLPTSGRTPLGNITVSPIPSEYVIPSGTVTISQSSGADVAGYASANVVSGEASQGTQFGYTSSGTRWRMRGYNNVTSAGWFESGQTQGAWASFYAVPSGTVVTPTESSQTVGGNDYMMQGAVTVSPIPSQYIVPSGTQSASTYNPSPTADRVIASGTYLTGSQTIKSAPLENVSITNAGNWQAAEGYYGFNEVFVPSGFTDAVVSVSNVPITLNSSTGVVSVDYHNHDGDWNIYGYESGFIQQSSVCGYVNADITGSMQLPSADVVYIDVDGDDNPSIQLWVTPEDGVVHGYYYNQSAKVKCNDNGFVYGDEDGKIPDSGVYINKSNNYQLSTKSASTITPTTASQTAVQSGYYTTGSVTVAPIPSQYIVPSGTVNISSNGTVDVTQYASASISVPTGTPTLQTKTYTVSSAGTASVSADAGYDGLSKVTITTPSGSATPASSITGTTATVTSPSSNKIKLTQTVSNTPQVTAGYISSGTAGNTAVSLTGACTTKGTTSYYASTSDQTIGSGTFITGTQTFKAVSQTNLSAENIKNGTTINISNGNGNIWSVTGTYSGGGGSSVQVAFEEATLNSASSSITFTGLNGEPTSFVCLCTTDLSTGASPFKVAMVVYDGTDIHAQTITNTNNAQVTYDGSNFSYTYNNGSLTITSSGAYFQDTRYGLTYSYDGTAGNVKTADVQVGSGATSITFTGLEDEPVYWSCIFKSNFSTSNGYQRVIGVEYDTDDIYGLAMDSVAHNGGYWSSSYNNGSLTITSQGTNQGGYFHQPGYYQLTYVIDASGNYQTKTKTYTPTTSQQTETITADNGYDALKKVDVTVNAMPTMTLPSATSATSSGTSKATITPSSSAQYLNIPTGYNGTAQYYTISASGGGGGDKNVQVLQSTSRANSSSLTKVLGDLTVSKTGTYDIYWSGGRTNTSTSYTWGTRLYVDGSGYGTENTSWTNNVQSNHLSNVSLTANQKLSVYSRGRSGSYYTFVPMLTIIEV